MTALCDDCHVSVLPNITVQRCTTLNPAALLPTADDREPHDCAAALQPVSTPPPDLTDSLGRRLLSQWLLLSVLNMIYSLLSPCLDSGHWLPLQSHLLVNCLYYTDSRLAPGVVHDFGAL